MMPHVVIVGAGNLGLACAARMAAKGTRVTMLTRNPDKWTGIAVTEDCKGCRFEGPMVVSDNPLCVAQADLIFLCLPGNALKSKIAIVAPYLRRGTPILSVFSGDGFFFVAEEILGSGWPVMGFQRVPFICRTKIPYRIGGITGYKKELFLAHRNLADVETWRQFVESMFDTKTTLLDNFYEAALVNGNVILHPARLMSLQKRIDSEGPFVRMPLFYEEWDDVASEWAIRLDEELRAVAVRLGANLMPLLEYYESSDAQSLARKIRGIEAFKGISSPVLKDGLIDCASRYVQSDVKIALAFISKIAHRNGIPCESSDLVLKRFAAG